MPSLHYQLLYVKNTYELPPLAFHFSKLLIFTTQEIRFAINLSLFGHKVHSFCVCRWMGGLCQSQKHRSCYNLLIPCVWEGCSGWDLIQVLFLDIYLRVVQMSFVGVYTKSCQVSLSGVCGPIGPDIPDFSELTATTHIQHSVKYPFNSLLHSPNIRASGFVSYKYNNFGMCVEANNKLPTQLKLVEILF